MSTTSTTRQPRTISRAARSRPTIGDVAKAAGVARATVSAVLNNRPHCYASVATRQRVQEAAQNLGYRPTPMAHALMGKRTATMGLIAPGFESEPSTKKFCGFEAAARAAGKFTFMVSTENRPDLEDMAIRNMLDRYVDGIAIYPTERGPHHELRKLVEQDFPVVTFDSAGRLDFEHDDVSADIVAEGGTQAKHLVAIGRRRLCLLINQERCYVNDLKTRGFMEAAESARGQGVETTLFPVAMSSALMNKQLSSEYDNIRTVLSEHRGRFDAIAVLGDLVGMAVVRIAVELGHRVPEDLAVVAINGSSAGAEGAIPISSVWHDSAWIGAKAFELISDRLDNKAKPGKFRQIKAPVHLIERPSTIGWDAFRRRADQQPSGNT